MHNSFFILSLFWAWFLFISGSGNFGEVFSGVLLGQDKKSQKVIAIKCLKDLSNRTDFFKEAIAACELNHENIVEFLGIVKKPNDMIIFEFMEGGQLLNYLKVNQRMENPLPISDMIEILIDICKGCAYMELMKFVHRDLAARNCLLTSTDPMKRKVKICKTFHYSNGIFEWNLFLKSYVDVY